MAQQGIHGTVLSPLYALKERNVWMVELNTNASDEECKVAAGRWRSQTPRDLWLERAMVELEVSPSLGDSM